MRRTIGLIIFILFGISNFAFADHLDPVLSGFYNPAVKAPDIVRFKSYAGELGEVASPKFLGPANTLGGYGFDVSWEMSITKISSTSKYWHMASKNPPDYAKTMEIHLQKGLPFSLQLEGLITHIFESSMWGLGLALKWAPIEGYKYIPDVAFTPYVGTLLNSQDLAFLDAGFAFVISKPFAVGGVMVFTPYIGYKFLFVNASSHLTKDPNVTNDPIGSLFVIPRQNIYRNNGMIGLLISGTHLVGGAEFTLGNGADTYSFSFKMGFRL